MTNEQIECALANLGLHRRWFTLGVLTEPWLVRLEQRDELPERVLGLALSAYLAERAQLDDDALDELLALSARADHRCSLILAGWRGLTIAQLARIMRHEATATEARDRAAAWHEVRMFEQPDERDPADLIGFIEGSKTADHMATAPVFKVGSFRNGIAWRRRLTIEERRRIAALLVALPEGSPMRCHTPAFGLSIASGTGDELAMSICFQCNNAYYNRGGARALAGASPPARELLDFFLSLSPATWRAGIED